ncbi:hypothetical protein [Caballeronia sp. LZ001]|uniref:hypothetical protein n=1 Tax=Caballeronia sp. LZ001 TaxID=3038553 RepID=UPI002862141E|nr:hypothetical protein [Caballeronia sp. LZ001]MDR5802160.1 DUF1844 domain-containing protein [Caballeronia sp. LZ001]
MKQIRMMEAMIDALEMMDQYFKGDLGEEETKLLRKVVIPLRLAMIRTDLREAQRVIA